jgi:hypothetical protein
MGRFCVRFGGSIVLWNYLMLEVKRIDRGELRGMLSSDEPRQVIHRLVVRPSKRMRERLSCLRAQP